MTERCHACRYYQPHYLNQGPLEVERPLPEGSCRRYPPVARTRMVVGIPDLEMDARHFTFPIVGAADWCGEFERIQEERDDED